MCWVTVIWHRLGRESPGAAALPHTLLCSTLCLRVSRERFTFHNGLQQQHHHLLTSSSRSLSLSPSPPRALGSFLPAASAREVRSRFFASFSASLFIARARVFSIFVCAGNYVIRWFLRETGASGVVMFGGRRRSSPISPAGISGVSSSSSGILPVASRSPENRRFSGFTGVERGRRGDRSASSVDQ